MIDIYIIHISGITSLLICPCTSILSRRLICYTVLCCITSFSPFAYKNIDDASRLIPNRQEWYNSRKNAFKQSAYLESPSDSTVTEAALIPSVHYNTLAGTDGPSKRLCHMINGICSPSLSSWLLGWLGVSVQYTISVYTPRHSVIIHVVGH